MEGATECQEMDTQLRQMTLWVVGVENLDCGGGLYGTSKPWLRVVDCSNIVVGLGVEYPAVEQDNLAALDTECQVKRQHGTIMCARLGSKMTVGLSP